MHRISNKFSAKKQQVSLENAGKVQPHFTEKDLERIIRASSNRTKNSEIWLKLMENMLEMLPN